MKKERINWHSSVLLIVPKGIRDIVLLEVYDSKYTIKEFQGHFLMIGGNANGDKSPIETLRRELGEEVTGKPPKDKETVGDIIGSKEYDRKEDEYLENRVYASTEVIESFRKEIIENLKRFGDYIVSVNRLAKEELKFLTSVFFSEIDPALFDKVQSELEAGRHVSNEGFGRVFTAEQLASGEVRGAWGHSKMIGDFLGISIPEYSWVVCTSIGRQKESYNEYKNDFEYVRDPESGMNA